MEVIGFVDDTLLKCRAMALSGLARDLEVDGPESLPLAYGLMRQLANCLRQVSGDTDEAHLVRRLLECSVALVQDKIRKG